MGLSFILSGARPLIAVCLSSSVLACGDVHSTDVETLGVEMHLPPVLRTVTWHASGEAETFAPEIAQGCLFWRVVGVECVRLADRGEANIVFLIDRPNVCDVERDGARDFGRAFGSGNVVLCAANMRRGDSETDEVIAVIAHEIGHQLGVDHVPYDCDGKDVRIHDSGAAICGRALMNARIRGADRFHKLTRADLLAYDIRGAAWSDIPEEEMCLGAAADDDAP